MLSFESGDRIKLDELPEDFGDLYWAARDQLKGWYTGEKALFTSSSKVCRGIGTVLMFVPPVVSILLSALLSLEFLTLIGLIPLVILLMAGLLMVMMTFDRRDSMKKRETNDPLCHRYCFHCTGYLDCRRIDRLSAQERDSGIASHRLYCRNLCFRAFDEVADQEERSAARQKFSDLRISSKQRN